MSNLRVLDPLFADPFDSVMRRMFSPALLEGDAQPLRMRVDVSEKDDAYLIKADIPGVKKEDIHVRIDGNVVQIDAELNREKDTKDKADKLLRSERYWGSVSRSFSLAQDVDDGKVDAKYADGVLSLTLPKKPAGQSKRITVQ